MAEYYFCKKCGKTLHQEDFAEVFDHESGTYVEFCPMCGNHDHFEEAARCEACGEVFKLEDMTGKLCDSCFVEAVGNQNARSEYFAKLDERNQRDVIYQDAVDFANFITERSGRRYI